MDASRSERERLHGGILPALEPGTKQTVATTAVAGATTNAVSAGVCFVELYASKTCFVRFTADPVANPASSTTGFRVLGGNAPRVYRIRPGQKVAAIRDTEDGSLEVVEMS